MKKRSVVTDSSDIEQLEAAARHEREEGRDLEDLLKTEIGRRFIHDLIFGTCHIDLVSRVPGDPEATAFNEGGRAIGQDLLNRVRDYPNLHIKMLLENHYYDGADPKHPAPDADDPGSTD